MAYNKSTDKYLNNTFRKRERDKIKIRKNNQNKEESLSKQLKLNFIVKIIYYPLLKI